MKQEERMNRKRENGKSKKVFEIFNLFRRRLTINLIFGGIGLAIFLMLSWDWLPVLSFSPKIGEKAPFDIVAYRDIEVVDEEETRKVRERAVSRIKAVFVKDERVTKEVLDTLREKLSSFEFLPTEYKDQFLKILADEYEKGIDEKSLSSVIDRVLTYLKDLGVRDEVLLELKDFLLREVKPNVILDEAETEKQKQLLMREMAPVVIKVHRGEVVVRKGEPLSREHLIVLDALGFSKGKVLLRLFGLAVISILISLLIYFYMREWYLEKLDNTGLLYFLLFSVVLLFLISKLLIPFSPALAPIGIISISYSVLFCSRFAIFATWLLGFATSLFKEAGFIPFVLGVFGGTVAVMGLKKIRQRSTLIRAGLLMGFVNALALLAMGLFISLPLLDLLTTILLGFLNGIVSSIVVVGSMPYIENLFELVSPLKLLELADPSHPLLKRLQVEAPGTYHHSLLVANLAEAAAEEVGADSLLARVGAYYHDIGKLKRPHLFVENQMDQENYHARIKPSLSMLVIVSHVKDSVELAKEYGLPQQIIDIIIQHHGTTIVSYFYHKAKEEKGDEVNPDDFRYPGPKPQTKEAAIVMLADSVEAMARSLSDFTPSRLEGVVRETIKTKVEDGQLSESPLSFRDLERIVHAFVKVLRGMYHSRIEYPEGGKENESPNKRPKEALKEGEAITERNQGNGS